MTRKVRKSGVLQGPLSDREALELARYWVNEFPCEWPGRASMRCDVADILGARLDYTEADVTRGYQQCRAAVRDIEAGRI